MSAFLVSNMYGSIKQFYGSTKWKTVRKAYIKSKQGLCERCLKKGLIVPAEEVHHKVRLTRDNINDDAVTTNFDNLEALCTECHEKEHEEDAKHRWKKHKGYRDNRRYAVDAETGKPIIRQDTP